jgi:hypothetical protein
MTANRQYRHLHQLYRKFARFTRAADSIILDIIDLDWLRRSLAEADPDESLCCQVLADIRERLPDLEDTIVVVLALAASDDELLSRFGISLVAYYADQQAGLAIR